MLNFSKIFLASPGPEQIESNECSDQLRERHGNPAGGQFAASFRDIGSYNERHAGPVSGSRERLSLRAYNDQVDSKIW